MGRAINLKPWEAIEGRALAGEPVSLAAIKLAEEALGRKIQRVKVHQKFRGVDVKAVAAGDDSAAGSRPRPADLPRPTLLHLQRIASVLGFDLRANMLLFVQLHQDFGDAFEGAVEEVAERLR